MQKMTRREFLKPVLIAAAFSLASPTLAFRKLIDNNEPMGEKSGEGNKSENIKGKSYRKATLKHARGFLLKKGFRKDSIDNLLNDARLEKLDLFTIKPGEKRKKKKSMTYLEYRKKFEPEQLAKLSMLHYEKHSKLIAEFEKSSHVPVQLGFAIYAIESKFGEHIGKYNTFNLLLTMAEDRPRRAKWAMNELTALIRLCAKYGKDPLEVYGSHGSAIGPGQFIPSTLLRYSPRVKALSFQELLSEENTLRLIFDYLRVAGADSKSGFRLHGRNYKAAFAYNHSHYYAKLAMELAELIKKENSQQNKVPK